MHPHRHGGRQDVICPPRVARLPKICGYRPFFGISLSITSWVPFVYLRLRKKLETSYSVIRPKWAGNRNFCAQAPASPNRIPLVMHSRLPVVTHSAFKRVASWALHGAALEYVTTNLTGLHSTGNSDRKHRTQQRRPDYSAWRARPKPIAWPLAWPAHHPGVQIPTS